MINTIEALQGLYVALGGELSDVANVTTIPDMLTAISTVAAAGASELPAVKTADNGKLLTVVSGKWAKADAPTELPAVTGDDNNKVLTVVNGAWDKAAASGGGSGVFVVTFTVGDNGLIPDKSFNEALSAHNSGAIVIFRILSDILNCNDAIADYWRDNESEIDYFESINFTAQINAEDNIEYLVPDHISWASNGIIKETTAQINTDT